MSALYNEIEPYAVEWLRNLERAGHVAPGRVESRSIVELTPADVAGATQFHTFAGIGVWSHALRLAGWPDDLPVWTGSCPCQPWSVAGGGGGFDDERHLWPEWFRLIRECRPPVVLGEQVASKSGLAWLDAVFADMEGAGYACAAFDLCAAGVGAPHIRQRLYFAAIRLGDSGEVGRGWGTHVGGSNLDRKAAGRPQGERLVESCSQNGRLADSDTAGRGELWRGGLPEDGDAPQRDDTDGRGATGCARARRDTGTGACAQGGAVVRAVGDAPVAPGAVGWLGDADDAGPQGHAGPEDVGLQGASGANGPTPTAGFWGAVEWLPCRDGKWRPTQPGLFPLAHGVAGRVGKLRAYGNAIVAPLAVEFCRAVLECLREE